MCVCAGCVPARLLRLFPPSSRVCVGLFADYRARVRIVYLEVPPGQLRRQNRERPDAVPDRVIDRLMAKWEVPDPFEGHQVDWIA